MRTLRLTISSCFLATLLVASARAVVETGYIYIAGGGLDSASSAVAADGTPTGDDAIYSVLVGNLDITTGQISKWRYTSQKLPESDGTQPYSYLYMGNNAHVYNGYLYVGPGDWNVASGVSTADIVCYAKIKPDGDLEPFAHSSPIVNDSDDLAINGTAIVEVGGNAYYYTLGGTSSGSNIVAYAKINTTDGSLGAWNTTTPLVSGDWFNAGTGVGDQLINVSGNLRSPAGRFVDNATVASDGTIGSWSTGTYDSTASNAWAMTINTAISPNGTTYAIIAGGKDGPDPAFGRVYTSPLTGGVPGSWTRQAEDYPGLGRGMALVTADDLLIGLVGTGGSNTSSATTDVYTARIDDSGVVQNWTAATPLIQPRGWSGCAFYRTAFPPPPAGANSNWTLYE